MKIYNRKLKMHIISDEEESPKSAMKAITMRVGEK